MSTNVLNTANSDYSSLTPIVLINPNGYSISDPTKLIVDTKGGTDFSGVRPIILVDTNGNSL